MLGERHKMVGCECLPFERSPGRRSPLERLVATRGECDVASCGREGVLARCDSHRPFRWRSRRLLGAPQDEAYDGDCPYCGHTQPAEPTRPHPAGADDARRCRSGERHRILIIWHGAHSASLGA